MASIPMTPPTAQVAGHHHHHGGGKNMQAVMDSVSKSLGMSVSDLKAARQQGTSLSDLATSKGVTADQLMSTITQALQQADPSLSTDRVQQIATRMVSAGGQAQGAHGTTSQGADSDGDNDRSGGSRSYSSAGTSLATVRSASTLSLLA